MQPECDIAMAYCGEKLSSPFIEGEINPYDISKPCTTLAEDLCVSFTSCVGSVSQLLTLISRLKYPETSVIKTYLDQPWVRSAFLLLLLDLGVTALSSVSPNRLLIAPKSHR